MSSRGSRIPHLGPRGEGWVAIQFVLFGLVAAAQLTEPRHRTWWALAPLAAGLLLFAWSARSLGPALSPYPRPRPGVTRVRTGPYRFTRHPMYVAVLLMCAAAAIRAPWAWLPTAVLAVVLALKAHLENRWLDERDPRP